MLNKHDAVLLGISGGPDSLALLLLFLKLKKKSNGCLKLFAVHINHKIRKAESDTDENFVRTLCKKHKVKLFVRNIDVVGLAKKKKLSLEDAARNARFKVFELICNQNNIKKVALAHTKNDQAETFLMRVLRGSGLQGLSGIWPVRKHNNIVLIRPLLNISKKEILQFLRASGDTYCIDSTNRKDDYLRNKIRLKTIPYLKRNFNIKLEDVFCREADILREAYSYVRSEASSKYLNIVSRTRGIININLNKLEMLPKTLAYEILRIAILESKANLKDISYDNLHDILRLSQRKQGSQILYIDNDIKIVREYSNLAVSSLSERETRGKIKPCKLIKINGEVILRNLDCKISTKILKDKAAKLINENASKEYIDFNKINKKLSVRTRKSGDKFKPLGLKRKKSLKKFFIDMKIPAAQRDFIPLLVDGDQIVWVAGIRLSEDYKVTGAAKRILELKISYL